MTPASLKFAFIGSHGVGKTTLCYGLAARLKRRDVALEIVHEVARRCPLPINSGTTAEAQRWILHTQIAEEILASARYPVVLCDRSVLDNYVYFLLAAGSDPALDRLVSDWLAGYDLLIQVPILEAPRADGIRAADPNFQRAVDLRLRAEVAARGIATLDLEAARSADWLEEVEAHALRRLRPAQLELL
ncbi:MAG: ATP-binding protein [Thermoanaerobaculia bacterium]|jgi:nicotinamide riboside kinase|nr:ATP-binding protein [Thermoanaerobaculia bacterium]MBP9823338.1 ATP-binding protein [Thermoanaerobaculia bacterium]